MASAKCPNMSRLPLVGVGAYPESDIPWDKRTELVVGGCQPDEHDSRKTECYDEWSMAMIRHVLEANHQANTIVLLSVGAGVLELRTLKTLLELRGDGDTPIDQVVLVDPHPNRKDQIEVRNEAAQVVAEYRKPEHLGTGVGVLYYTGPNAYSDAIAGLHFDETRVVAVVGALNLSFGLLGNHREHLRSYLAPRNLVSEAMRRNRNLYVVQSFRDIQGVFTLRGDDTASEFLARERERTAPFERMSSGGPVTAEERVERHNRSTGF